IERSVVRGSRYFKKVNNEYWKDPRTEIVIEDARSFLVIDREEYDVIISEPSNPWMAGTANLFTREAFSMFRRRLGDGGIMCQWLQKYNLSERNLKIILATFAEVFPFFHVFRGAGGDLLLIGSGEPIMTDFKNVKNKLAYLPEVREGLEELGIYDALSLLISSYVASRDDVLRFARGVNLRQTDDTPYLEYFAPYDLFIKPYDFLGEFYMETVDEVHSAFNAKEGVFTARTYFSLARQFQERFKSPKRAEEMYHKAIESRADYNDAIVGLAGLYNEQRKYFLAEKFYKIALTVNPDDTETRLQLYRLYFQQRLLPEAEGQLRVVVGHNPDNALAWAYLGDVYYLQKKLALAEETYLKAEKFLERGKDKALAASIYFSLGVIAEGQGQPQKARRYLEKLMELNPRHYRAILKLVRIYLNEGDYQRASAFIRKAAELNPDDPHLNHLNQELQSGGRR
ncbi:MAG: tetratricopeptide repeat protein, partial [bacterium]